MTELFQNLVSPILPSEVWKWHIFPLLDFSSLMACTRVCRFFFSEIMYSPSTVPLFDELLKNTVLVDPVIQNSFSNSRVMFLNYIQSFARNEMRASNMINLGISLTLEEAQVSLFRKQHPESSQMLACIICPHDADEAPKKYLCWNFLNVPFCVRLTPKPNFLQLPQRITQRELSMLSLCFDIDFPTIPLPFSKISANSFENTTPAYHPKTTNQETTHPETTNQETTHPETTHLETTHQETTHLETTHLETPHQETTHQEISSSFHSKKISSSPDQTLSSSSVGNEALILWPTQILWDVTQRKTTHKVANSSRTLSLSQFKHVDAVLEVVPGLKVSLSALFQLCFKNLARRVVELLRIDPRDIEKDSFPTVVTFPDTFDTTRVTFSDSMQSTQFTLLRTMSTHIMTCTTPGVFDIVATSAKYPLVVVSCQIYDTNFHLSLMFVEDGVFEALSSSGHWNPDWRLYSDPSPFLESFKEIFPQWAKQIRQQSLLPPIFLLPEFFVGQERHVLVLNTIVGLHFQDFRILAAKPHYTSISAASQSFTLRSPSYREKYIMEHIYMRTTAHSQLWLVAKQGNAFPFRMAEFVIDVHGLTSLGIQFWARASASDIFHVPIPSEWSCVSCCVSSTQDNDSIEVFMQPTHAIPLNTLDSYSFRVGFQIPLSHKKVSSTAPLAFATNVHPLVISPHPMLKDAPSDWNYHSVVYRRWAGPIKLAIKRPKIEEVD